MVSATKHGDSTQSVASTTPRSGRFDGVDVHAGPGGGLASSPLPAGADTHATHYHAARMDELGDVVLAVTRTLDPTTAAILRLELRAFAASAPGRGALAAAGLRQMLAAPGAIAYASIEMASPGDAADERRVVQLQHCVVTDAAPTVAAAERVAHWLRRTWETELAVGSWPALRGSIAAFAIDGGAPADWARTWLAASEHRVESAPGGSSDDDRFLKVFAATWLEPEPAA